MGARQTEGLEPRSQLRVAGVGPEVPRIRASPLSFFVFPFFEIRRLRRPISNLTSARGAYQSQTVTLACMML